jgi:hypothetical protein
MAAPFVSPNLFQLSGNTVHISYSTTGIDGKPHFHYQDSQHNLSFTGDEIRQVECDLGALVSVTIQRTIDSGSTSFSVLIPRINLDNRETGHIRTQGIKTLKQAGQSDDLILSVFVHGWKHNADACDSNVGCFRETLKNLHALEKTYAKNSGKAPRKIVGIYVGWRGLSASGNALWENASFYSRKAAATHVALGSVRELFARLRHFQKTQNERRSGAHNTRLMILGHSFGGLIVYSAVSQFLMTSAVADDETDQRTPVEPFGDLVVLVNPAFEGSRYEPLYNIAQGREYAPGQNPVLVVVTSENDAATGKAFPVGRWINALFEKYSGDADHREYERQANLKTVGHIDRYRTHSLTLANSATYQPLKASATKCGCPYAEQIDALGSPDLGRENGMLQKFNEEWLEVDGHRKPNWRREYSAGAVLTHVNGKPDNPFWVVSADPRIIDGHNDFFTPVFLNFLRELYDDTLRKPRLQK